MRQIALTLGVRLVMVLVGLVSSIATARYLGPEGRGVFFFWMTVASLIVQFGNFGLNASNIYLHAKKSVSSAILAANSLVVSLVAGLVLSGLATVILSLNGYADAFNPQIMCALLSLSVSGLYTLLGTNLLVAMGRMTAFNLLELFNKLLMLFVLIVVVMVQQDPKLLLMAIGFASLLSSCAVMWVLVGHVAMMRPSIDVFRSGFAYGLRAYTVSFLPALVAKLNAFMLQYSISATDYGAWSIATQLLDVMLLLPISVGLVLLPKMMRSDAPRVMIRSNVVFTVIAMSVLSLIFILFGRQVIVLLYGEAFEPAFWFALWGLPGLMALSVISILSQYLASVGIPLILVGLWSVVALIHASLANWLILHYGASGAMASLSVAYIIGLVLILALIRDLRGKNA